MKNLKEIRDKDLETTTGGDWQLVSKKKLLSLNLTCYSLQYQPINQVINDVLDLVLVYFFLECSIPKGNSTTVA